MCRHIHIHLTGPVVGDAGSQEVYSQAELDNCLTVPVEKNIRLSRHHPAQAQPGSSRCSGKQPVMSGGDIDLSRIELTHSYVHNETQRIQVHTSTKTQNTFFVCTVCTLYVLYIHTYLYNLL